MKKILVLTLVFVMVVLSACAPAATTAAPAANTAAPAATAAPVAAGKPIVALCLPAMDNPLMLGLKDAVTKAAGDKFDVQVASADGDPNKQATQVENYAAMKAKYMFVMPAEASSLVPKLVAARQAGMVIMVAGGDPGNAEAYDSVMMMNQYLAGWYEAWMAKQWLDKTYPDATDGSIETAVFISTLNTDAAARSNGEKMIAEPYLKNVKGEFIDAKGTVVTDANKVANPAYSSKVKVVQTVQAEMFQAGQTAMQNVLTTNPNVKLVLSYAGDGGMGASQAILDEYAKGSNSAIKDLNKVAVFGVGMIGAEGNAVLDSGTNKTVFRGTIRFGGDLIARTQDLVGKMLGGQITKVIYDPLDVITNVNGKLMSVAIPDTEYFVVPTGTPTEVQLMGPPK
jgi:ribose transport system substrate-binding protein